MVPVLYGAAPRVGGAGVHPGGAVLAINASGFIVAAQSRAARIAVGASATRRSGKGTVEAARAYLRSLELAQFSVAKPRLFRDRVDRVTDELRRALPPKAGTWGLARKLINIFLRDALYTTYLCEEFGLGAAENLFELPLDSITSWYLRYYAGRGVLPRWRGVKRLSVEVSDKYQESAMRYAATRGLARVHLDTYWWGERVE